MKNLLIDFEGIDGAGKFTNLHKLKQWLLEEEITQRNFVTCSKEPNDDEMSGTPLGKMIKGMLNGKFRKTSNPIDFQRLYILERIQDIVCFINPFLEEKRNFRKFFLMERFAMSTIAYGMLSVQSIDFFIKKHEEIGGSLMRWADINIIIDISAEEAMKRINMRNVKKKEGKEFFEKITILKKVRENYLKLAKHKKFKENTIIVDGEKTEDLVFDELKEKIKPFLF